MAFTLSSNAFEQEGSIPSQFTCEGRDISPALSWSDPPEGTQSFVLIVDDPDAPDPKAPKTTYVHWLLYNIPADVRGLPENMTSSLLPMGTLEGNNDWHRTGYGGPCPPIGRHRYFFKLYALDVMLPDLNIPNKSQLVEAMKGHILQETHYLGTYQKQN